MASDDFPEDVIVPIVKTLPPPPGSYVIRRYGGLDAQEKIEGL